MLEFRKDIFADERDDNLIEVGQPTARQDILGHVTGTSPYYDDHRFANLLHLKILRSPHAHARIRSIDDSAAARAPGVKRIIRAADVPVNLNTLLSLIQFGKDDEPSLASDVVRYKGADPRHRRHFRARRAGSTGAGARLVRSAAGGV